MTWDYELLDFGRGRKLERFGPFVLDRPAPAAARMAPRHPDRWRLAQARFVRRRPAPGRWEPRDGLPESWLVHLEALTLELRPTPAGQVGLFPEHAALWDWLAGRIAAHPRPPAILHLFAYTGGGTLAAAAAGAGQVAHVDAAANVVRWARRNAEHSGLRDAPIRWICEDAARFVRREAARGRAYDGIVLDPPTYGHGPRQQSWQIDRDLPGLLEDCRAIAAGQDAFLVLSCHTPQYTPDRLAELLRRHWLPAAIERGTLELAGGDGARLPSGSFARADCR